MADGYGSGEDPTEKRKGKYLGITNCLVDSAYTLFSFRDF